MERVYSRQDKCTPLPQAPLATIFFGPSDVGQPHWLGHDRHDFFHLDLCNQNALDTPVLGPKPLDQPAELTDSDNKLKSSKQGRRSNATKFAIVRNS